MSAILFGIVPLLIQFVTGMFLPGIYLQHLGRRVWGGREEMSRACYWIQVLSVGSLYLAVQMLAIYLLLQLGARSVPLIAGIKLAMDFVACGILDRNYHSVYRQAMQANTPARWSTPAKVQALLATLFGIAAIALMPHGLDNSAIGWLTRILQYPQLKIAGSHGAITYISFLYVPSLLLHGFVPVATLAACLKVALSLLVALVSKRLSEVLGSFASHGVSTGWLAVVLQLLVLSTAIGKFGVFDTGKETVFALVFFFALAAELMSFRTEDRTWYFRVGLVTAASMGFGAMAVPYCVILLATYVVFSLGSINPARLTFACLACAFPVLAVSIHAMLDWPWLKSCAVVAIPALTAWFLIPWTKPTATMQPVVSRRFGYVAVVCLFLLATGLAASLMPIKFHYGYFPFDGKAGVAELLAFEAKFGDVGIAALVFFLLAGFYRKAQPGVLSLLCFPIFAAVPALVMARYYDGLAVPINPQNVWDWAKDVPRWISGFYLSFFTVAAWVIIRDSRWIQSLRQGSKTAAEPVNRIAILLIVCLLIGVNAKLILKRSSYRGLPTYTTIGGHHDRELAEFIEWAYLSKSDSSLINNTRRPLIVSDDSPATEWFHVLAMYGIRTVNVSDFEGERTAGIHRYWVLCPEDELSQLLNRLGMDESFRAEPVTRAADGHVFQLFENLQRAQRPQTRR